MMSPLFNQSVFITGGTGSFGRAFAVRALADGATRVVVFSRDEAKQAAMAAEFTDARMRFFVGDVREPSRVQWAMRGCTVVVHAAAMKRIDTCEVDPVEAIHTNVLGSQHVAMAAIQQGVSRALLLSTDKAAAPCTLYGMTKATAERAWIQSNAYAAGTATRLSATRYGNVLGSTGSILPIWRGAVAKNHPIMITDPTATRFWMRMDDAVELVIHALTHMMGGETFVPKLHAASLSCLADAVAPSAVRALVGLRAGEKLHETLVSVDEASRTIDKGSHYVIQPAVRKWGVPSYDSTWRAPDGFSLTSDTAPHFTPEALRALVEHA